MSTYFQAITAKIVAAYVSNKSVPAADRIVLNLIQLYQYSSILGWSYKEKRFQCSWSTQLYVYGSHAVLRLRQEVH